MQTSSISWTEQTWNPASGCTKISAACKYCYAESLAERRRGTPAFPVGFDVVEKPWKLDEPRRLRPPSLIFTNSMTDMFHELISDEYRDRVLDVMRETPRHRYQVLTKRPDAAAKFFATREVPASMWLGCTMENEREMWRVDALRSIDARVRFLSIEPILEDLPSLRLDGIAWVITGGESGSHLTRLPSELERRALVRRGARGEHGWMPREDRMDWIRRVRDLADANGVAHWFKQWGGPLPHSAGRVLDGRTHDGMPTHVDGAMPVRDRLTLPLAVG